jgi:hypothetical protein
MKTILLALLRATTFIAILLTVFGLMGFLISWGDDKGINIFLAIAIPVSIVLGVITRLTDAYSVSDGSGYDENSGRPIYDGWPKENMEMFRIRGLLSTPVKNEKGEVVGRTCWEYRLPLEDSLAIIDIDSIIKRGEDPTEEDLDNALKKHGSSIKPEKLLEMAKQYSVNHCIT